MANNQEAPDGYRIERCNDIGLAVLVPAAWNTWTYDPSSKTHINIFAEECLVRTDGMLEYETGLSIGTFRHVQALSGYTPARFALSLGTGIRHENLIPTSDMVEHIDGPLTFFSRTFERREDASGEAAPVRSYAVSGISRDEADMAYVMMFETPMEQWETGREIGRTMIEGARVIEG
jgi:hypothetical protein